MANLGQSGLNLHILANFKQAHPLPPVLIISKVSQGGQGWLTRMAPKWKMMKARFFVYQKKCSNGHGLPKKS